jgi:hypothetical protein
MKKACFILVMLTFTIALTAQDLIIRTNGEYISCKITKIDASDVYFTIYKNGAEVHTSLSKAEIKSMQFGVGELNQVNDSTMNKALPSSSSVTQTATDMSALKKKRVEGFVYLGCALPTWQGDIGDYADALTLSMYGETGMNFNFKPGPRILPVDVGLGLGVNITSWFTLQGAVELAPKGMMYRGTATYDGIDYTMKITHKTNYLEIPIGIMLSTRSWNKPLQRFFYIRGGIAPAFNVVAKTRVYVYATDGDNSDSDSDTADMEGVAKQDLCGYAAIGYGRKGSAALEFKFEKGTETVVDPETTTFRFYNTSYSFNLIFYF